MTEIYEDASVFEGTIGQTRLRVYKGSGVPLANGLHWDTYDVATINGFEITPVKDKPKTPQLGIPPTVIDQNGFTQLENIPVADLSVSPQVTDAEESAGKPTVPQQTFGSIIAELKETAKLSQRELALAIGIDHSSISRLEGRGRIPSMSTAVALAVALKPDKHQTLRLIASLAKEHNRAYMNELLGLSENSSIGIRAFGLNTNVSTASTPVEKAEDYRKRRGGKEGRRFKRIAELGGIDKSGVSRFFSGERIDISGSSFGSLVEGLGLITQEQVVDFFYSFGIQSKSNVVSMPLEAIKQIAS